MLILFTIILKDTKSYIPQINQNKINIRLLSISFLAKD